ncbi:uncharacterized protein LOC8077570 isoform X2 [Sorghum bicolor]|uniref:uncharacterized protein LOC8077570 isoform X2 n=1 Tax=Sorghum bicolor TaxID=4558 RepID=UPI000B4266A1|nr:uncharacterized protein LOC8077570 isoform X2 [Sorghum bicolor]|eukprot:XP_021312732.1 uncharacterized protein LOC8077570 isoform X2 [Sorghum bicolor]
MDIRKRGEMEEGRTSEQRSQRPNARPAAAGGVDMGDGGESRALRQVAVARKWLENPRVGYDGGVAAHAAGGSQELSCVALAGARVSVAEPGRVVCSLRVRAPVADAEGSWHTGAIAAVVDCVCSAVVHTVVGAPTATVHYSLSYFSPADRDVHGGGGGGASGEPEGEADGCDG